MKFMLVSQQNLSRIHVRSKRSQVHCLAHPGKSEHSAVSLRLGMSIRLGTFRQQHFFVHIGRVFSALTEKGGVEMEVKTPDVPKASFQVLLESSR